MDKTIYRIMIEESALLNDFLFQDALEPIANVPRLCGDYGHNPQELNGMIHFLTTAYFKNSEYDRCLRMTNNMADLTGDFSIGASWELGCEMGRGESRAQILAKKETLSSTFFKTNYCSEWIGSSDNCLLDITYMLEARTLEVAELKGSPGAEYYVAMDVARSQKTNNNQSSITVLKVRRDRKNMVKKLQLVNLFNLPSGLNFTAQAIELKRIKELFKARMVIIDANGLGQGLYDELQKTHLDPITKEEYPAYNPINTDDYPDVGEGESVEDCLFALKAQGIQTDIILNFINVFESGKIELLPKIDQNQFDSTGNYLTNDKLASVQTDLLIEEVSNLSLKTLNGGKLAIEMVTKSIDKDRVSSLMYCIYYILKYENKARTQSNTDISKLLVFRQPKYR